MIRRPHSNNALLSSRGDAFSQGKIFEIINFVSSMSTQTPLTRNELLVERKLVIPSWDLSRRMQLEGNISIMRPCRVVETLFHKGVAGRIFEVINSLPLEESGSFLDENQISRLGTSRKEDV